MLRTWLSKRNDDNPVRTESRRSRIADVPPAGCHLNVYTSSAIVSRCVFRSNSYADVSVVLLSTIPYRFTGNIVEQNFGIFHSGTILIANANSQSEISYNLIRNNINSAGGTIYSLQNANPRIHHNIFENNISLDTLRGSILTSISNAIPRLDSNIFVNNSHNTFSIHPDYPVTIDARNNWWGHESGPYHPTLNPQGQGDSLLSDSVYFIPWLTSPPDTTMPNAIEDRVRPEISATWQLSEVYPNPFNSSVRLIIAGFTDREFRLTLHNLLGQEIAEIAKGPITGGQIVYNAPASLASGVYFARAVDKSFMQTKKIVFLK